MALLLRKVLRFLSATTIGFCAALSEEEDEITLRCVLFTPVQVFLPSPLLVVAQHHGSSSYVLLTAESNLTGLPSPCVCSASTVVVRFYERYDDRFFAKLGLKALRYL